MKSTTTSLGDSVLPYADTDRPDEDDPEVQRIAKGLGIDPVFLANVAEETAIGIHRKLGFHPPLEDVLAALEAKGHEMIAEYKEHREQLHKRREQGRIERRKKRDKRRKK